MPPFPSDDKHKLPFGKSLSVTLNGLEIDISHECERTRLAAHSSWIVVSTFNTTVDFSGSRLIRARRPSRACADPSDTHSSFDTVQIQLQLRSHISTPERGHESSFSRTHRNMFFKGGLFAHPVPVSLKIPQSQAFFQSHEIDVGICRPIRQSSTTIGSSEISINHTPCKQTLHAISTTS